MPKQKTPLSPIVSVAKKVCPAVITIVVSKDVSRVEGFYFVPLGDQQTVVPKIDNSQEKPKSAAVRDLSFLRTDTSSPALMW